MRKLLFASAVIVGLAVTAFAPTASASQGSPSAPLTEAQIQQLQDQQAVLLEAHLAGMKAGLKLNDEQAKNWPGFEAAVREAAKARWDRTREALERVSRSDRPSAIERMSIMADHLEKSATELRKVVNAATPLYASLDESQKRDFGPLMREFRPAHRR